MKETNKIIIEKFYDDFSKSIIALILFLSRSYILNQTVSSILLIISIGLAISVLSNISDFYLFKFKKGYEKYKVPYLFVSLFIGMIIVFYILYLLIGLGTTFYVTMATCSVAYFIALVTVLCTVNNKKKSY